MLKEAHESSSCEVMQHAFSLGLSRWQQQSVDVWVSHKGTTTELFCGAPGWRVVMQYANPQMEFNLFSLHLKIPLCNKCKGGANGILKVGDSAVCTEEKQWVRDELYEMRWGVESHSACKEATSIDAVCNSLDIGLDIFALLSLVAKNDRHVGKWLHLENLGKDRPFDLINVWIAEHADADVKFIDTLECTSYGLHSKAKRRITLPTPRFSLIFPTDMLTQCVALVGCCAAEEFCGSAGLLRISMDGTMWMCTDTNSAKRISAVCCDSVAKFV